MTDTLRRRLASGLRQIAFFIIPSAVAFVALGDVVAAAVLQTGRFGQEDSRRIWAILAGSGAGLLATTLARLYASTYYVLHDTRTPLRYAVVRVAVATALGYVLAIPLPARLGIDPLWGTAGLTAAASVAGWMEMAMLRASLIGRIGRVTLGAGYAGKLWTSAIAAAAIAWSVKIVMPPSHPVVTGVAVLGPFGLAYFALAAAFGVPIGRLRRDW